MSDAPPDLPADDIQPIGLADEMRKSYLDYAMSVIVSRALPDARDGLKPVHRRILHAMNESGYTPDKAFRKCARIVGEVMGKYHPHGNLAIYDAMVRLAQPFSLRVPLVDGQGNFGSVDGDPPAAERYTEARLSKPAMLLLEGIDEDTVDFQPNYDDSESEPRVLPAAFPNLLINGGSGIAVGMATNIPTHNAGEVIDAALALIADPLTPLDDLVKIVPGPDFPTGGIIIGRSGIRAAYETGRGSITIRCRAEFEEVRKERTAIIVTEIPYQVNKAHMLERIAELVRAKQVEGIAEMRDESDRSGMRVVIECKRDATPEVVLNQLYRFSNLQISYGINMLALDGGRPRLLGLRDALQVFLRHREDVILRRSRFRLNKARDKAHELVGLAIAVANIDEMIVLIRTSPDPATARARMCERDWPASDVGALLELIDEPGNHIAEDGTVRLTETQARAILDLRLQRLTGLEREKIDGELRDIATRIAGLLNLLSSQPQRMEVIRDELLDARKVLATPRQTAIADALTDQDDESLIEPGRMVVTITRDGFIKRTPLDAYRAQNRGGRGRSGAATRGDDVVVRSFNAHTHQWVLFFTSGGKAFREKVWKLPEAGPNAKGRALVNLLPEMGSDETTAVLPLPQDETLWENLHLVFATASGGVRRNRLSDFRNMRASGLIAMKLDEGDRLIGVATCRDGDDVLLATRRGRCIRFQIIDDVLRVFAGRDSTGVRGIRLASGDAVISLCVLPHMAATPEERAAYLRHASAQRRRAGEEADAAEPAAAVEADGPVAVITLPPERLDAMAEKDLFLLTVTDQGFGKRTSAYEYRVTGRGGQGFANMGLSARTGSEVVATLRLTQGDDVMLVTDAGQLIRTPGDQVRITGRQALGVTMLRVGNGERVTSVFPIVDDAPAPDADLTDADLTDAALSAEGLPANAPRDADDPTIVSDPFDTGHIPEDDVSGDDA